MEKNQLLRKTEFNGASQFNLLDGVMGKVIESLDKGRNEIFAISQQCREQQEFMRRELEEIILEREQLGIDLAAAENKEQEARLNLMDASRNFTHYAEEDIKLAYEEARLIQISVFDIKQREIYLRRRFDELSNQLKQIEAIAVRSGRLLNHTSVAIKLLRGNDDKIINALEENNRGQHLEMWIIESQESERRKIARDLHDGPAQSLAGMLIHLDLIERLVSQEANSDLVEELRNIEEIGRDSLDEIRRIMFDLKPTFIHEDGFINTLSNFFQSYEDKYDMEIEFIIIGNVRKYDLSLEIALFRIVQEAVTNARKHSGVSKVIIKIEDLVNTLQLIVEDDGKGFDLGTVYSRQDSFGIIGMKERIELFGGIIDIVSSPGNGTRVYVKVPLEKEAYRGKQN